MRLCPKGHARIVGQYVQHRAEMHDSIAQVSKRRKEAEAARYDRGITQTVHHINDLVMVYQKGVGELQPRWRGPFRIVGDGGSHESSSHPPRAGTALLLSPGHPYQVAVFEIGIMITRFVSNQHSLGSNRSLVSRPCTSLSNGLI